MGIEGEPAREAIVYDGGQYELVAEGRGAARTVLLEVGDATYDFSANSAGDLVIEGLPASAAIPATLPAGSFETQIIERDRMFVNIFYLALALIIMGVGFLKANISSIVGQLYEENDPRARRWLHALLLRHQSGVLLGGHPVWPARRDRGLVGSVSAWPVSACCSAGWFSSAAAHCSSCRVPT